MKMIPPASLAFLSAAAIVLCGQQVSPRMVTTPSAFDVLPQSPPSASGVPAEEIAAAGLGGMDGAIVFNIMEEEAAPAAQPHAAALTNGRRESGQPGS